MPRITQSQRELVNAIRLTVEYVGMDTLPPRVGWAWFDAIVKYDPELAKQMNNEWETKIVDAKMPEGTVKISDIGGNTLGYIPPKPDHGSDIRDVVQEPKGPVRFETREQQIQREYKERFANKCVYCEHTSNDHITKDTHCSVDGCSCMRYVFATDENLKIKRSRGYGKEPTHFFETEHGNSRLLCGNNNLLTAMGTHDENKVTCPECLGIIVSMRGNRKQNKRAQILQTAEKLINGDRADTYGAPEVSFGRIGRLLSGMGMRWLEADGELREVNAEDVALALTQLKISRIISSRDHEDSWVDAAGYIALGGEMALRAEESDQER